MRAFLYARLLRSWAAISGYNRRSTMATTDNTQQGSAPQRTPAQTAAGMNDALADRSQFIRTMAKDMAALSNSPAPATPIAPLPKREEVVSGVALPTREEAFFEKPQPRTNDLPPQPVALPSMQEAGSIVAAPTPVPQAPTEDKEAILARLRQKVSESADMRISDSPAPAAPVVQKPAEARAWPDIPAPPAQFPEPAPQPAPAPAPIVQAPAWQNIPAPAPAFTAPPEPAPARMPPLEKAPASDTYREPVMEAPVPQRPVAAPDALHTYTSDFSDRIDRQSASTFSVLAAEQDRGAARAPVLAAPSPRRGRAALALGTGVLLFVLAGGGIFATYQFVMTMRDTPLAALAVPTIVFADEYRELSGTGASLMSALAASANAALLPDNVLVTYILTQNTAEDGSLVQVPDGGAAFLRALQVPAPDILLRNIADDSTVGVVNADGETRAFFALRVDSYERTYAGMLTWEPLMRRDLEILYPLYPAEVSVVEDTATTTATSTASTTPVMLSETPSTALTRFADAIVAGHDVRILRDSRGRSLLLYGYANKRTLIIARDEAAFETLVARLKSE